MRCSFVFSGSLSITFALIASALLAGRADAARVVDVRVGVHKEFTRLVFQLDELAEFQLSRAEVPRGQGRTTELTVELRADAQPTAIARRQGLVESVRVLMTPDGSVARVRLRTGNARVREMTLAAPPRIVIDVSRPPSAAAPAPSPKPESPAPQARVEPAREAKPAPAAAPPPVSRPVEAKREPAPAEPEPKAVAEAPVQEMAEKAAPMPDEAVLEAIAPEPPPAEAPQEAPARPMARRLEPTPPEPEAEGSSLLDPRLILTAAAILVLLVAWRRIRRAAAAREKEPFSGEGPLGFGEESDTAPAAAETAAVPEPDDRDFPTFRNREAPRPAPAPPAVAPGEAPEEEKEWGALPASPLAGDQLVRELERRIQHLERRLEEVTDSRERLERGMSAHTEELRVQRSAIARAQRVLRGLTRPDEGPEASAPDPRRGPIS